MRKWLLVILLILGFALTAIPFAYSQIPSTDDSAGRVNSNILSRPRYLLKLQFNGNANAFPTADPSPAGTSLTETSAMGRTQSSGIVTVELTNGFTAPITLTAYYWLKDAVTPSNSHWTRCGPNSTFYQVSVDTNYATAVFVCPPNTPFLVLSSAAVTGHVYVDCIADPNNANRLTGY